MRAVGKKDLKQYLGRKRTIARYTNELRGGDLYTLDTVSGSMPEHPYVERAVVIEGRDVKREAWLVEQIEALTEKCRQTEAFVESVDDVELKDILRYRYLQGGSWMFVARKMECETALDALRMRAERFLKKS